ncbi:ABC transporter substrate-binding protein [Heyndrickxia vini]|uniref:ABC transporter substrate-binding protein n=1 Tax=Heyndrickxia vini TaxID=1476025 RepID=A0ABX7E4Z8_9BACI|nr:ABC transporter substrate-binding protein [Heyndrickxia vini]QQZ10315.1 ABC transporter substrate-binding protein [Heyndrickxia vini]
MKKILGISMSLLLSAGLMAGCGSAKSGGKGGDEILIGANLELSGGVASYGQSILEGVNLALDEINKEGIDGKKIKLVKVDNKSDAAEATSAATKLIDKDKVSAIIGAATSTNTLAQVQIAQGKKIPLITPTGTSPTITFDKGKLNDFVFRTCFIDPFQGTVAANFASNELKVKTASILIDSSSDYAKGLAAAFKEAFEKNGGTIVGNDEAYVQKDTDFRSTLTRIKSKNPEFVFVPGYYEEVGLILKQAREIGLDVPFMGGDGWDSPKLIEIGGKEATNNSYITNHYSSGDSDAKIQDFVKAFKAKYKDKTPDAFNALGYDTLYLLTDAIKRAGSSEPEKIQKALAETKGLELISGTMTLDDKHNPIKSATILKFVNGEQKFEAKINP